MKMQSIIAFATIAILPQLSHAHVVNASGKGISEPIQKEQSEEVHEHEHDGGKTIGKKEASEIDAQLIAKTFGWGVSETLRHMENQDKFGELVSRIYEEAPYAFASSAMARNPGEHATIWVKGQASRAIFEIVDQFNREQRIEVRIEEGMRFSEFDQEKRMEQAARILEKKGFEGIGAVMLPGDILLISLPASEKFPESEPPKNVEGFKFNRDYVDEFSEYLFGDKIDPRGIYLTFTKQKIDVDLHARGGRQVYGASSQCTSGFSVERISDGVHGIATAAHCTGMSTFNAESPESDFSLSHRGEHCGDHGDLEWKTSGHLELAEYWASPTDRRDVNSRENLYSVNNLYCVHSRMQGTRTCDRVYSVNVTQSGNTGACNGVETKRLVAMDNNNVVGGDSGGPWSYSTEAVGIVKGYKWIWFGKRDTFSMASRLDEALGVRVRIK